ncbi:MAG: MarR family winged helix-turn-helix transcriptional regulator [Kineosporiaceae bacterium]
MPGSKRLRRQEEVDATLAASRALVGVVARSLAEVLEHVTLPQFRVLLVLCAERPLRSGILAERLGIHQSTFTRTADRLVAQGLIWREPNAESRREVLVDLTEAGQALVADVMKVRRAEVERILGRVPARDRTTIRAGFEAFAKAAGEPAASLLLTLGV